MKANKSIYGFWGGGGGGNSLPPTIFYTVKVWSVPCVAYNIRSRRLRFVFMFNRIYVILWLPFRHALENHFSFFYFSSLPPPPPVLTLLPCPRFSVRVLSVCLEIFQFIFCHLSFSVKSVVKQNEGGGGEGREEAQQKNQIVTIKPNLPYLHKTGMHLIKKKKTVGSYLSEE